MYNKCLEYLLDYRPEKTISKFGCIARKAINPIVRFAIPFLLPTKQEFVRSVPLLYNSK